MDGIIEKFNIFDLFTMLIPGVIISILLVFLYHMNIMKYGIPLEVKNIQYLL